MDLTFKFKTLKGADVCLVLGSAVMGSTFQTCIELGELVCQKDVHELHTAGIGDIPQNPKTPSLSVYEKHEQELSTKVQVSEKNADNDLKRLYKEEEVLRKRYFNTIQDMKGKLRVFCRLCPLSEKEIAEKERSVVKSFDEFTIAYPWKEDERKQHLYDRVFDDSASQKDVFDDTRYLVQSAVDGYNVCIFAYGQTGSGKTFTIYGAENNPGLTPRATAELFKVLKRDSNKYSFSLKAYMVELYKDTLVDLLLPKNSKRLKLEIKEDSKGMAFISNVTVCNI